MTMRKNFEKKLNRLNENLTTMSETVATAIERSVSALATKDEILAERVIKGDTEINDMERMIESSAIKIIMREQPVASDLRFVSSTLKMITDLERIGDQAADIAVIVKEMVEGGGYSTSSIDGLVAMARLAEEMVKESVEAFVSGDLAMADLVVSKEEEMNEQFRLVRDEIIDQLRAETVDPEQSVNFLMIAKYLERIGDHAENVIEWVTYSITGEHKHLS